MALNSAELLEEAHYAKLQRLALAWRRSMWLMPGNPVPGTWRPEPWKPRPWNPGNNQLESQPTTKQTKRLALLEQARKRAREREKRTLKKWERIWGKDGAWELVKQQPGNPDSSA